MTEERRPSEVWVNPYCCEFPGRWNRVLTVAIRSGKESDIPSDKMMLGITTRNGMTVQIHISRDQARELVDAIITLGDRMEGIARSMRPPEKRSIHNRTDEVVIS